MRQLFWDRCARPVHPEAGQSGLLRAFDIQSEVIPDIGDLAGTESERIAGCVEDRRIGFGRAQLVRRNTHLKIVRQPYLREIGGAIGQRAYAHA